MAAALDITERTPYAISRRTSAMPGYPVKEPDGRMNRYHIQDDLKLLCSDYAIPIRSSRYVKYWHLFERDQDRPSGWLDRLGETTGRNHIR